MPAYLSLTLTLLTIILAGVKCQECKESEPKCSSFEELTNVTAPFFKWWRKQCPDNTTLVNQTEFDTFKICIMTHLEPCIRDTIKMKVYYVEFLNKEGIDWTHLCSNKVGNEVFDYLENCRGTKGSDMDQVLKEGTEKCSVLIGAFKKVEKCVKV